MRSNRDVPTAGIAVVLTAVMSNCALAISKEPIPFTKPGGNRRRSGGADSNRQPLHRVGTTEVDEGPQSS